MLPRRILHPPQMPHYSLQLHHREPVTHNRYCEYERTILQPTLQTRLHLGGVLVASSRQVVAWGGVCRLRSGFGKGSG